ncbi:Formate/nitrite transporter-domain-containing protein, partial [Baffinella frigidus]
APPAVYEAIVAAGETKAKMPAWKIFYMGLLAGAYISFGSCLAISIGGACQGIVAAGNLGVQKMIFGAFGLPVGLPPPPLLCPVGLPPIPLSPSRDWASSRSQGKATPGEIAKSWIWSYMGNLVGSIAFAFLVFASGVLPAPTLATVKGMAVAKTSVAFLPLVLRGILCNWLVCIGIWQVRASLPSCLRACLPQRPRLPAWLSMRG